MNADDVMAEAVAADALDEALQVELDVEPPERTSRDLVYETGTWVRYLWDDLSEDDPDSAANVRERYPGTEWPALTRELFARLYGTATKLDPVPLGGEWAEPLHDTVDQLSEWRELADECRGDDLLAFTAACDIQNELELPEDEAPPDSPTDAADDAARKAEEGDDEGAGNAHQRAVDRIEQSRALAAKLKGPETQSALRRRLRAAVAKAQEGAEATKQAMAMLGCGSEPSAEERRKWRHRIHENQDLVRIANLAGRMEAKLEAERAKVRSDLGREELVGLKLGGSIAESVPMERALFSHPVLGLVQAAKMAEGRLLQNRQVGLVDENKAGSGPLIFACDESGSMSGYGNALSKNVIAKAVMLTLARRCGRESRTFAVVHWSHGDTKEWVVPQGAALNERIAEELSVFLNGGTDIPGALDRCAAIVRSEQTEMPKTDAEKADVIFITDACSYEHGEAERACKRVLKTGARIFTVHVDGGMEDHPVLKKHSTRYLRVTGRELGDGSEIALTIHNDLETA